MNPRTVAWCFLSAVLFRRRDSRDLLLLVAGPESERLWPYIVYLSDTHMVTPAVWLALRRTNLDQAIETDAARYFETLHCMNVARNEALTSQLNELVAALNDHGIVPILLKGAAYLKLNLHGSAGARVSTDLDIMVPPERIADASRAFKNLGYRDMPGQRPRLHHHVPVVRPNCAGAIELHWELMSGNARRVLSAAQVRMRAQEHTSESGRFAVLSPEHALLHSFAHAQIADRYDENFFIGLRAIQDLIALDAQYGSAIDWLSVSRNISAAGYARAFARYLYCAFRVAGFEPPIRPDYTWRESAYFEICRATIQLTWLRSCVRHFDRLRLRQQRAFAANTDISINS